MTDNATPRRIITLTRKLAESGPFGTFGDLDTGTYQCRVTERPRVGLIADHPCIDPTDEGYDGDWTVGVHPKHPECYELRVPGRTAILIHSANWMEQLLGCLAPCVTVGALAGDYEGQHIDHIAGLGSKLALTELITDLGKKPFKLIIKEV